MQRPPTPAPQSIVVGKPQVSFAPGRVIASKYRVEREIGRGGYGIVLRARHLTLDQVVAIKILTPGDGGEKEWAEDAARFRREAQATAALKGEHLVRILDVDVLDDGSPYMVMELLEGDTLHNVFHTRGPLSITESVDTIVQVLAALAEAHAAGIVHRDLKPANVYLTRGAGGAPVAKVLDFGVSKMAASTISAGGSGSPLTRTGAVIGTVAYMAPEQMADAKRVDGRADLWSVGTILYEIMTKKLPFDPQNAPTLVTSILTKPPVPLRQVRPDVPPRLEAAVMKCLEKAPDMRFASAAALAAALAEHASPNARTALDQIRKAGPPRGAAAPAEKARVRLPGGSPSPPPKKKLTLAMIVASVGIAATVALLGMSVGILVATRKPAGRRAAAAATSPAPASASAPATGHASAPTTASGPTSGAASASVGAPGRP